MRARAHRPRVPVYPILGAMSGGDTIEMLLEDYPTITEEDIRCFGSMRVPG